MAGELIPAGNLRGLTGAPGITEAQAQAMIGSPEWVDLPVNSENVSLAAGQYVQVSRIAGIVFVRAYLTLEVTEGTGSSIPLMNPNTIPTQFRGPAQPSTLTAYQVGTMYRADRGITNNPETVEVLYQRSIHRLVLPPSTGLGDAPLEVMFTAQWPAA